MELLPPACHHDALSVGLHESRVGEDRRLQRRLARAGAAGSGVAASCWPLLLRCSHLRFSCCRCPCRRAASSPSTQAAKPSWLRMGRCSKRTGERPSASSAQRHAPACSLPVEPHCPPTADGCAASQLPHWRTPEHARKRDPVRTLSSHSAPRDTPCAERGDAGCVQDQRNRLSEAVPQLARDDGRPGALVQPAGAVQCRKRRPADADSQVCGASAQHHREAAVWREPEWPAGSHGDR